MSGFRPLIGRRHFLASAALGTVAALVPSSAHAATLPPGPGAETLTPTPSTPPISGAAAGDSSIIGAAASFQPVG